MRPSSPPISRWIVGAAMFMIVESIRSMASAMRTTARIAQRRLPSRELVVGSTAVNVCVMTYFLSQRQHMRSHCKSVITT